MTSRNNVQGFTLIEMAVAILLLTLVLGSLLVPLTTQVEQRKVNDTRKALEEIREALLGYAIINGRLPCPDTDTDPSAIGYGIENSPCTASVITEGYLPWKTLAVAPMDSFGITRTTAASPRIGDWRYRVDRNFSAAFILSAKCSALDQLNIVDSAGNSLNPTTGLCTDTVPPERPIAIVYSAGPNTTADGRNAVYEGTSGIYQADVPSPTFDDILISISRPILMNRMVAAGKLP